MEGGAAHAVYLYCFALRDSLAEPPAGPGVDGRSVVALQPYRRVVAVVSEVALDGFTGPDAEAHLSDIEWVGPRAWRHEQVIEEAMQRSPVLPARFGTLFSSMDLLLQLLARHHDEIVAFAERMAGREEWSVKGYLARSTATQALAAEEEQLPGSPGARFLRKQRLLSQAGARLREWTEEARSRLREELLRFTPDLVERAVVAGATTESGAEMVFNWAALVPRSELSAMLARVEELNSEWRSRGLEVQCTGPLPPYSFTPALGASR